MTFFEKILSGKPTLSYEFFPPKSAQGWATLYSTLAATSSEDPDYVSVTYGAGGSTREKTVDLVSRIQKELNITAVAHLTCVGHSQPEIKEVLQSLKDNGIKNILALRGDPPKGELEFKPHPNGFRFAFQLIDFMAKNFDFNIGCACYPEKHLEAQSLQEDIEHLKLKQDMGAKFAITQLFFDNTYFYKFRDLAVKKGITMPLIAGIMPVSSITQLSRFKEMSGTEIPKTMHENIHKSDDVAEYGVEFATQQCDDLLKNGIAGIHLYTLNKSNSSLKITDNLRAKGYFTVSKLAD